MKVDRYEIYTRFDGSVELVIDPDGSVCYTRDVAKLEAKCAELESKCAELLEVCESALAAMKNNDWNEHDSVFVGLRAAIVKAKGEVMP